MCSSQNHIKRFDKIDPHHHLWDLKKNRHPWLISEIEESFLGNYKAIRINYLLEDYLADVAKQNIVKSVHIQAGWDRIDSVNETKWLQSIADNYGYPHGIVAYVDLSDDNAKNIIAAHCQYSNIRGIRQILSWHENPFYSGCSENWIENPKWRRGYRLLEQYNLSFDMQIYPMQMQSATLLAIEHPNIQIIINHAGMPLDFSETSIRNWYKGLTNLASCRNVAIKISGLGMFYPQNLWRAIEKFVPIVIDIFGVDRCMFASNFPVDKLYSDYNSLFVAFQKMVEHYSVQDQEKLFYKNAEKFYRL